MDRVRCLAALAGAAFLLAMPASAEEAVCAPVAKVPLERHLRQLSLDLLGRPPTWEEYQAAQKKGSVDVEDIRAMMNKDEFYARIRNYHRALLRANLSASVNDNGNSRLSGSGAADSILGFANNSSAGLRGGFGAGCDSTIEQDSCLTATNPDAHAAPLREKVTTCRDTQGVPMPVSFDYDTSFYKCTALATATSNAVTTCADLAANATWKKYTYFCDRRGAANDSFLCLPDPGKSTTAALTVEVTDAQGRIIAFEHPNIPSKPALTDLKRCTLDLELSGNVKGNYAPRRGCIQREGYVMSTKPPFWATGTTPASVKVCAIEAQDRAYNPWTMASCETARFASDRSCGCGDRMRRCEVNAITAQSVRAVHDMRVAAFNEEPLRIVESVVKRDEPYFNILTTRRSFVNGTLSEYYRQNQGVGVFSVTAPASAQAIPTVPYDENGAWAEYTRDAQHSGVLTTPAFLYRFPTQRARVNEFYEAFLCKTFAPPADASLPPPEDSCNRQNNLAVRCGCNYCHATIEPTGAHWGRYAERSSQFLNADQFPRFDPKCRDCALNGDTNCGGECSQYVMQAYDGDGANSLGMLKTYLYRTADEEQNIEAGPQLLVQRMMQTGDLERCTVKRIWNEFLGRPMTAEEQRMYLNSLSQDFAKSGHKLKSLIEHVVTTDAYRRID
ncbi:DUF1585 domain-containing protein [Pyxidicoccus parkwayensis]|uniref:DUF1585 domain-containing protein n=2 Tax=Pyxidicoccus parkwayensis TaxID=2813578 RepID=A0ABX7NNA7_9BACT|nr:DUF1585 domain-containing protein [Pyxidicoccus parkwaysis]QSQ20255.1 DUF1585 domain-containing protein [Pyxidicoccus parkwaysis]